MPRLAPVAWLLRVVVALAVAVSAVVHLYLWNQGYGTGIWLGPAFLLQGIGGLVLAVLVVVWRSIWPLLGAVGFGASTLGGFFLATTSGGLFGVHSALDGWGEWTSLWTELIAIVVGIAAIVVERRHRPPA
ncbi:hypothetical protein [Cellulomonas sp. HZM]|uniref:hypothetical protein n=1 Tax=Cellulomonas sp. HZM TaxID=1454010 RepID=UPI00068D7979|nr:hypothetical protein [Cellulomonas sp. HZM]